MNGKKIIFIVGAVILILIAITVFNQKKVEPKESIVDTSIEVTPITAEDRKNKTIDSAIENLNEAGLKAIKQEKIAIDEINGYRVQIDDQIVEMYYAERAKLANIVKSGSLNGEAEIEINGKRQNAITCGNMFVLNCNNKEISEKIIETLGSRK